MKLKVKAKAMFGAAAVMMGIFAPMFSANANPLHDAIRQGKTDKEIISLAKLHPEWTVEEDDNGDRPQHLLRWGNNLKSLLSDIAYSFECPLHDAVERGDKGAIELLLEEHPTWADTLDILGQQPIFYVRGLATLKFLYDHGADLNAVSADGYHTPLIIHLRHQPRLIKFMLDKGADPNARDKCGRTVLHRLFYDLTLYTLKSYAKESIDILLGYERVKQMLNAVDDAGYTPLDILYECMLRVEKVVRYKVEQYGLSYAVSQSDAKYYDDMKCLIKDLKDRYGAQLNKYKDEDF